MPEDNIKNLIDNQKAGFNLISKSMGLPTFNEMLEDHHGDFTDKETKAEKEMKECQTCKKLKESQPTPEGDEICHSCGDREMMDYEPCACQKKMINQLERDIDVLETAGMSLDEIQKLDLNEIYEKAREAVQNQEFKWGLDNKNV